MIAIFTLLILFQLKHFFADYPLQGKYMLGKFNDDWSFFLPLLSHTIVHGVFTFAISVIFVSSTLALFLAILDVSIHFMMDRVKAGKKYLGRFNDKNTTIFWIVLGLDQIVHHLTHYVIILIIYLARC